VSEERSISLSKGPITTRTISRDLRALGVGEGQIVLVHSSLSRMGWVCGGAVALIQALQEVLTPSGTLIMPSHTSGLSEPSHWQEPPVPEEWWEVIREEMPPFDPRCTPTRGIGLVPELFRTYPDVLRSGHPQVSFAAWGAEAAAITRGHALADGLGEGSPLARIHERDGHVLLIGASHDSNTSLHLAEHRAHWPSKTYSTQGAPVLEGGGRVWKQFESLTISSDDFEAAGTAFDATGAVQRGFVGNAASRFMRQRALVDFGVNWFAINRT